MASYQILHDSDPDGLELLRYNSGSSSATLRYSSNEEEQGATPIDNSTPSNADDEVDYELPEFLISEDTLVYVGFTRAKAQGLWVRWVDWTMRFGMPLRVMALAMEDWRLDNSFLHFIVMTVQEGSDDSGDDDKKWRDCLQSHGVNIEAQDFLLNPDYAIERRAFPSCMALFLEFIEMRYDGLSDSL
ncbi:hypothetical protein E0Z10_g6915 [Xylaria hypoxylon]|uniref:Uncharacterized protein n=1 Tax=Xylaria hypoxylon TaxID=37992 RepID=A0A4Z0YCB5_9PEZI|nr:hypothetical protein E0Z10_g6915 [Xylaria hypoxylon]